MDLRDTPEEAAFRAELRAWIETNLTDEIRRGRFEEAGRDWSRKLYEAGYAGLTWPKEYGGASAPVQPPGDLPRGDGARRGAARTSA